MIDIFNKIIREVVLLEYSEKVIQQLVDKFTKEGGPDEEAIRAYVGRFVQINNKLEKKDPFQYTWKEFERIVDANPTKRIKAGKLDPTISDANLIYNKKGIRVYAGIDKQSCIKYGNGYSFCISSRGKDNLYRSYRLKDISIKATPYFIFNDNLSSERIEGEFIDKDHLLVIIVSNPYTDEDPTQMTTAYTVTDADNLKERKYESLKDIQKDYEWIDSHVSRLIVPVAPSSYEVQEDKILWDYERHFRGDVMELAVERELIPALRKSMGGYSIHSFLRFLEKQANKLGAEVLLKAVEEEKFFLGVARFVVLYDEDSDEGIDLVYKNDFPGVTEDRYVCSITGNSRDVYKMVYQVENKILKDTDFLIGTEMPVEVEVKKVTAVTLYNPPKIKEELIQILKIILNLQSTRDSALSKLKLGLTK